MQQTMDFIVSYWSQIIIFFACIGYIVKRIFNIRDKKSYKRYEIFQEKKLDALLNFSSNYFLFHEQVTPTIMALPNPNNSKEWNTLNTYNDNLFAAYGRLRFFLNDDSRKQYYKLFLLCNDQFIDVTTLYKSHKENKVLNISYSTDLFKEYNKAFLKNVQDCYSAISKSTLKHYRD